MARANIIQTNFTSGEVSPLMRGRVDTTRYAAGAERIENFIVKPQGGCWRRSGTRYVETSKFPDKRCRVVKFEFSTVQAYVLEIGEKYIRFYKDGGIIVDGGGVPIEVDTDYLEADLPLLYFSQSADIMYMCHPKYPTMQLMRFSHTNWSFNEFVTTDGPYMSVSPQAFLRLTTVSDIAYLNASVNTFAGGDVGKFVEYREGNVPKLCKVLSFIDAQNVTVDVIDQILLGLDPNNRMIASITAVPIPPVPLKFGGGGPTPTTNQEVRFFQATRVPVVRYVTPNAKLTQSSGVIVTNFSGVFTTQDVGKYVRITDGSWWKITVWTDSSTVTATSAPLVTVAGGTYLSLNNRKILANVQSSADVFDTTDIGRKIRLEFSGQQSWGEVSDFVNTREIVVDFKQDLPLDPNDPARFANDGITDIWKFGAWSARTGYPGAMTFHEQRAAFARTDAEPQTMWMSKSGDYANFAPTEFDSTVSDDSAITYTIASSEANPITWLESGPVLLIGTTGQTWQAKAASSIMEPITPTNISVTPTQSSHGSFATARQQRVGSAVLFVQRSGRKVRELVYDYAIDGYVAKNLNIIAEHMLRRGGGGNRASETAYQAEPNNILWVVLRDGQLVAMTYEKDQEVVAWHVHILGGRQVTVESITTVPSIDGTEDSVYLVVRRLVNGALTRYIERLEVEFDPVDVNDKDAAFYLDCALSYDGASLTTFGGLEHLENETVGILADGAVLPNQVVGAITPGHITLAVPASVVHVGYRYRSLLKTLPLEGGSQAGTSQGKLKRATLVDVRLMNTIGFSHGPSEDKLTYESFRSGDDPMDQSPPLFTGDKRVSLQSSWSTDAGFIIAQDAPYPLIVLALMPHLDTTE